MAITLAASPRYLWQGLSGDTKPTDGRPGINDLFFETDTGNFFIFNGVSWSAYKSTGGGGGGGTAPAYANSVTATLATTQNDYAPAGYIAGTTNRLLLAAAAGGSTITGLLAGTNGWVVLIVNTSETDTISFLDASASSAAANRFSTLNDSTMILAPGGAAYVNYVTNQWVFA